MWPVFFPFSITQIWKSHSRKRTASGKRSGHLSVSSFQTFISHYQKTLQKKVTWQSFTCWFCKSSEKTDGCRAGLQPGPPRPSREPAWGAARAHHLSQCILENSKGQIPPPKSEHHEEASRDFQSMNSRGEKLADGRTRGQDYCQSSVGPAPPPSSALRSRHARRWSITLGVRAKRIKSFHLFKC